jgi:hypothetical protein
MKYSAFERALEEAAAGLRETEAEFERLKIKKEQLEALVENLRAILPLDAASVEDVPKAEKAAPALENGNGDARSKSTWMLARDVLAKSRGALTVPEIYQIVSTAYPRSPAQDAIRIAMMRKPEIFVKRGTRYALTKSQFELGGGDKLTDRNPIEGL